MKNSIFLGLIPVLMLLVPNVYAGGPRLDSPEDTTREGGNCYVDGYDAGVANVFNEDRDQQCKNEPGDPYSYGWVTGCRYSEAPGTIEECKDRMNDADPSDSDPNSLQEENRRNCYDDGYEDGQNNPFDQDKDRSCDEYASSYYNGFIAGCESAGNTKETCETFTNN